MIVVAIAAMIACWMTMKGADYGAIARGEAPARGDQGLYEDTPIRWGSPLG
jgi:cytochrome c oxidase cbb3-type subunit I